MSISRVGNETRICDFQQDLGKDQQVAEQPAAAAASVSSQQVDTTIRTRPTFESGNLKAAVNAKVADSNPAVGREFATAVNNILRSASKLIEGTVKFSNATNTRLQGVKGDAATFIKQAESAKQILEQGRAALSQEAKLFAAVGTLIEQLNRSIGNVQGSTNDLLFNASKSLQQMSAAAKGFEQGAQRMSNGDAAAIRQVMAANDTVAAMPKQIIKQADNFGKSIDKAMTLLAEQARTVSQSADSNNIDAINIKDTAHDLADKAYKFKYNVGEKIGSIIDEYVEPLTKALKTGIGNLFKSIFNPDKNPNGKKIELGKLVSNTQDLRNTIQAAQGGDKAALAKLQTKYGYNLDTAPKPGRMLLASNYVAGDLSNGQVTSKKFPGNGSTVATPSPAVTRNEQGGAAVPDLNTLMFGQKGTLRADGKGITLRDVNTGKTTTVRSMDEYKAVVAANREKLGMPVKGGEPIPVHLSLEGGGGKGKRFAPAFEEMYNQGVVPASVSGVSVGSIAAALIAGGLDPREADIVSKDPAAKKFFDATIAGAGILDGRELYRYMDTKLRELTGIKDRPVTFADLKMPCYLVATVFADSQPTNDGTKVADRTFVFSKENTPDTPVAMAVLASSAIPAAFDPVEFVDVATGRTLRMYDGGVVDQLPIGYQKNNLPEIAIQLNEPNINNPNNPDYKKSPEPLPKGNLISGNPFGNAKLGLEVQAKSAATARDYQDRTNPKAGQFILNVPTWNLNDFEKQNSTFEFTYNDKIDPELDRQSAMVTNNFLRRFMDKLQDPTASGTNLNKFPADTGFTKTFQALGQTWTATRANESGEVIFRSNTGREHSIDLGKDRLNDWLADDVSFGDLPNRLRDVIVDHEKFVKTFGV